MEREYVCQSCGMLMTKHAHFGENADGGKNMQYCCFCYRGGAFLEEMSLEEMIQSRLSFEAGKGRIVNWNRARWHLTQFYRNLQRWKEES